MDENRLGRLDFSPYRRWIETIAGQGCALKIFDTQGKRVWGHADSTDAEVARLLLAAPKDDDAAVRRLSVADGNIALYRRLPLNDGSAAGWAALVTGSQGRSGAPVALERLSEVFGDAISAAASEIQSKRELDQLTEELSQCYEELHLVYTVDQLVKQSTGRDEALLRKLLQSAAEHLKIDVAAYVRALDRSCIYATSLSKEIHNLDLVVVEMRGDLFRFVQTSGEALVLNEADDQRRAYVFTDMPYRVLACPVTVDSEVGGMVVLLNHMHKAAFTNNDRRLLGALAEKLSSLAKDELLISRMSRFTKQLADAMVEAVEAKDPYTRGHSERVNFLSVEIGKALGLPEHELQDLHWGSLLHDVGKIGIPDAILCKPARLTKDEYTFIKVHPERSYEILRHVDQLKNALPGMRHHQEMYDGKGYPQGLAGERIPLHARIMAVADTYDSITSSRAYRPGRSHEAAMAEIERVSGSQLDPAIVKVFREICEREPEWLERFKIRREKAS